MNISFHGAAGEVTGSCNLLTAGDYKILIDCGMFQGGEFNEQKNSDPFGFDPNELDAVIITHSHLDHVGRLPLLVKAGFKRNIYATAGTIELSELIMEDAVKVMEENYRRFGHKVLYELDDVKRTVQYFKAVEYHQEAKIKTPGKEGEMYFEFYDAGHIFGSAFVKIKYNEEKGIFSGDIGNTDVPILRDTEVIPSGADFLVCEATYGGRAHEIKTNEGRRKLIKDIVLEALNKKGVLMIPSFALERTQQLLYILNDLIENEKSLPKIPIFLDSPLAIMATRVYRKYEEYYNKKAEALFMADEDLFDFPGLAVCETVAESKQINSTPNPKIIIAGAGMMNGGRILHHALRYLSDSSNTIFFIGYQARGTLGREILEGRKEVEVMRERVKVNCHIQAMGALSAHADQEKLLDWIGGSSALPKKVILNHGEPEQCEALAKRLKEELGVEVGIASTGENAF